MPPAFGRFVRAGAGLTGPPWLFVGESDGSSSERSVQPCLLDGAPHRTQDGQLPACDLGNEASRAGLVERRPGWRAVAADVQPGEVVAVHSAPHPLEEPIGGQQPLAERIPSRLGDDRLAIGDELIGRFEEGGARHHGGRTLVHGAPSIGSRHGPTAFVPLSRSGRWRKTRSMPPSGASALATGLTALLVAALVGVVVAIARAQPPARLDDTPVGWVATALVWVLAASVTAATLTWIVIALRGGSMTAALTAGSMAALAGAAMMLLIGSGHPGLPVLGAAGFQLGAAFADRLRLPVVDGGRRIAVVTAALVGAELFAAAAVLVGVGDAMLLGAAGLALAAGVIGLGRPFAPEAFGLAVGAASLGVARVGGLETAIGVAALAAAAILATRRGLDELGASATAPADAEDRLPDLAARLADAVLRFDGRLRLADWNATAATLLDLDETSRGVRMEELLGIPITSLPADDRIDTVERGVGGLDVTVHRAGGGIVAIIRDPGRAPESERLSRELRGTIEELAQARRTIDLQRAELERTATIDPLTGLPSRPAILERLRAEMAEAGRTGIRRHRPARCRPLHRAQPPSRNRRRRRRPGRGGPASASAGPDRRCPWPAGWRRIPRHPSPYRRGRGDHLRRCAPSTPRHARARRRADAADPHRQRRGRRDEAGRRCRHRQPPGRAPRRR